jgi:hypothetical protein
MGKDKRGERMPARNKKQHRTISRTRNNKVRAGSARIRKKRSTGSDGVQSTGDGEIKFGTLCLRRTKW